MSDLDPKPPGMDTRVMVQRTVDPALLARGSPLRVRPEHVRTFQSIHAERRQQDRQAILREAMMARTKIDALRRQLNEERTMWRSLHKKFLKDARLLITERLLLSKKFLTEDQVANVILMLEEQGGGTGTVVRRVKDQSSITVESLRRQIHEKDDELNHALETIASLEEQLTEQVTLLDEQVTITKTAQEKLVNQELDMIETRRQIAKIEKEMERVQSEAYNPHTELLLELDDQKQQNAKLVSENKELVRRLNIVDMIVTDQENTTRRQASEREKEHAVLSRLQEELMGMRDLLKVRDDELVSVRSELNEKDIKIARLSEIVVELETSKDMLMRTLEQTEMQATTSMLHPDQASALQKRCHALEIENHRLSTQLEQRSLDDVGKLGEAIDLLELRSQSDELTAELLKATKLNETLVAAVEEERSLRVDIEEECTRLLDENHDLKRERDQFESASVQLERKQSREVLSLKKRLKKRKQKQSQLETVQEENQNLLKELSETKDHLRITQNELETTRDRLSELEQLRLHTDALMSPGDYATLADVAQTPVTPNPASVPVPIGLETPAPHIRHTTEYDDAHLDEEAAQPILRKDPSFEHPASDGGRRASQQSLLGSQELPDMRRASSAADLAYAEHIQNVERGLRDQKESHERDIGKLQTSLDQLRDELQITQQRLLDTDAELQHRQQELDSVVIELREASTALSESRNELGKLNAGLQRVQTAYEKEESLLEQKKEEAEGKVKQAIATLTTELDLSNVRLAHINKTIEEKQGELSILEETFAQQQRELEESARKRMADEEEAYKTRQDELLVTSRALEADIKIAEAHLKDTKAAVDARVESDVALMRDKYIAWFSDLDQRKEDKKAELVTIEDSVRERRRLLDSMENTLKVKNSELDRLNLRVTELESKHVRLTKLIDNIGQEAAALIIAKKTMETERLDQELESRRALIADLEQTLATRRSGLAAELEALREEQQDRITKLHESERELREELSKLNGVIDQRMKQKKNIETALQVATREIAARKGEIDDLKQQVTVETDTLADAKALTEEVEAECQAVESQLEAKQAQYDNLLRQCPMLANPGELERLLHPSSPASVTGMPIASPQTPRTPQKSQTPDIEPVVSTPIREEAAVHAQEMREMRARLSDVYTELNTALEESVKHRSESLKHEQSVKIMEGKVKVIKHRCQLVMRDFAAQKSACNELAHSLLDSLKDIKTFFTEIHKVKDQLDLLPRENERLKREVELLQSQDMVQRQQRLISRIRNLTAKNKELEESLAYNQDRVGKILTQKIRDELPITMEEVLRIHTERDHLMEQLGESEAIRTQQLQMIQDCEREIMELRNYIGPTQSPRRVPTSFLATKKHSSYDSPTPRGLSKRKPRWK